MPPSRLPRTVIVLSFVSLFNDLAAEMVIPLIPILLATVLAAGPIALGLVEGVADAVASFLKLWSGRRSDKLGGRRKRFAVVGYSLSNVARPLLAFAASWPMLLLLRSLDRVGKGLRSAPRDALLADATHPEIRGRAYGFHRALDNGGAVGGSLVAAAVLAWSGIPLTQVILWSAIPGALGVLLIVFGVHDKPRVVVATTSAVLPKLSWALLPERLRRYLMMLTMFTFARASESFIVLLGYQMGMSVVELLLLWAALNLSKALTSTRGGILADKLGSGPLILFGWVSFGIAFVLLGWVENSLWLWLVTIAFGLTTGIAEGPERSLISEFAAEETRGTAFGWYHLMTGVAAIPAGLAFGLIWQFQFAAWAFRYAGALALVAALLLHLWAWPKRKKDA